MRIYISTPINGRAEKTFAEKYEGAKKRVSEIIGQLKSKFPDAEFVSFADVAPLGECTEAQAMGKCVQAVMESDICVLDNVNIKAFRKSNGCYLETIAAHIYCPEEFLYLSDIKK